MPIPDLLPSGFLPQGIHECTAEEIAERFGRFQGSDTRPKLNENLVCYLDEVRQANIGKYLIVDGSFVTQKEQPGDVDILLVLKDDVDLSGDIPPYRYNAKSRRYITTHHRGLDFHLGFERDPSATEIIAHFQEVKYQPGDAKGILRINL